MKNTVQMISYDCLTNPGGRKLNEDSLGILIKSDRLFFILCDGLGGHGNGDVASSYVVEQMKKFLEQGETVEDSVIYTQQELRIKQKDENLENSMKTTLTCLSIASEGAKFVHVGDSRIYLFYRGKYKMRSQDHSVPQMLVNSGMIKEKEIRYHPDRGRLLRVMGTEWSSPRFQAMETIPLKNGMTFLLCSDGFWELIEEKKMEKILKKAKTPKEWLTKMESVVLENGKDKEMDNYSAIAVFVR